VLQCLQAAPLSKSAIAHALGKAKPNRYLNELMNRLLEAGQVAYTVPEKPQSRLQRYRLTAKGRRGLLPASPEGGADE